MGWTLQASEVVGSGPKIRVEIDASGHTVLPDTSERGPPNRSQKGWYSIYHPKAELTWVARYTPRYLLASDIHPSKHYEGLG